MLGTVLDIGDSGIFQNRLKKKNLFSRGVSIPMDDQHGCFPLTLDIVFCVLSMMLHVPASVPDFW